MDLSTLVRTFLEIALLRTPPHAVPASSVLLGLVLALHWAVGFANGLLSLPSAAAAGSSLVGTLVVVAFVHGALVFTGRGARTPQTLSALAGCEVLVGLLALPILATLQGGEAGPGGLVLLVLIGWNLAIASHVFRYALELPLAGAVVVALGYMVVGFVVMDLALPRP